MSLKGFWNYGFRKSVAHFSKLALARETAPTLATRKACSEAEMRFPFEQEPRLRLPSIRRALIQINADLLKAERYTQPYVWPDELLMVEEFVVLLEDRRFFSHAGFDYRATVREFFKALTFRRHGGASTIDMQFVRTITGYRKRKLSRKLYEMLLARLMQYRYSKIQILRAYMSCAFFGSHLIGVENASRGIFDKVSAELSFEEAAHIAALLVYPKPLSPSLDWTRKIERRAKYAQTIYLRLKKTLEKLPRS